jgi:hypothetical protein
LDPRWQHQRLGIYDKESDFIHEASMTYNTMLAGAQEIPAKESPKKNDKGNQKRN